MGQWIDIQGAGLEGFSGYLALPQGGSGPGLLLLQEIWGVNGHIRDLAGQFAAEGFVVLAPDVFWRQQRRVDLTYDPAGTAQARAYYQALDIAQARTDLAVAVDVLGDLPQVNGRLGVVGYCMGGKLAYELGEHPRLSAGVSYYPGGIAETVQRIERLACPYLFHFASDDQLIDLAEVRLLQPLMARSGEVSVEIHQGVGHGFACPRRPAWSMAAALSAKASTLWFLGDCLLGDGPRGLHEPL
ncbi:MAG: dienelactone hydrolase family protein [Paucimonas sp.]|jgi:carboxymethylenebutenolidase|nr:dienelactone hydrolase family protein [Paucimonas sp.]